MSQGASPLETLAEFVGTPIASVAIGQLYWNWVPKVDGCVDFPIQDLCGASDAAAVFGVFGLMVGAAIRGGMESYRRRR